MFHAAVAVAISSAAGGALASSHPARTVKVKPTIVLVHGSWADSPSWNSEVTALERLGYPVIALANPLRDLASDAAYAHSIRRAIKSPIVPRRSFLRWCCDYERIGVPNIKALHRRVRAEQGRVGRAASGQEPGQRDHAEPDHTHVPASRWRRGDGSLPHRARVLSRPRLQAISQSVSLIRCGQRHSLRNQANPPGRRTRPGIP